MSWEFIEPEVIKNWIERKASFKILENKLRKPYLVVQKYRYISIIKKKKKKSRWQPDLR